MLKQNKKCHLGWKTWLLSTTIRVAAVDVLRAVDLVEGLVPETIDRAAAPAVPASAAAAPAAAGVVEVAMAAAEDLVEVAMEAFTTVMDTEEITTPRGLTGGETEPAL